MNDRLICLNKKDACSKKAKQDAQDFFLIRLTAESVLTNTITVSMCDLS